MFQLPCYGLVCPSPGLRAGSGTEALCPAIFITAMASTDTGNGAASSRTGGVMGGVRVGWCWRGSRRDLTPAADNLDSLVIGEDRLRFKG